jgi:hypothetical protein
MEFTKVWFRCGSAFNKTLFLISLRQWLRAPLRQLTNHIATDWYRAYHTAYCSSQVSLSPGMKSMQDYVLLDIPAQVDAF